MASLSRFLDKVHDNKHSKWIDPIGWHSQEGAKSSSTKLVNESSRAMVRLGDKWGINTKAPEKGQELSQKDKDAGIGRWGENTIGGIAAVFGGMYAYGAGAGAGGGSATGGSAAGAGGGAAAGNGAFLGEGVASGVPAWDGAAHGMGLGFNPEGVSFASGNYDIPGGVTGKVPSNITGFGGAGKGLGGMGGMGGGGQQQPQEDRVRAEKWEDPEMVRLETDYTLSSKRAKTPASGQRRGLSDIDHNGDEIAKIQALTKRVVALRSRVNELKGARA